MAALRLGIFTLKQIAKRSPPVTAFFVRARELVVQQRLRLEGAKAQKAFRERVLKKRPVPGGRGKATQEKTTAATKSLRKLEENLARLNKRESVLTKRVQAAATPRGGKVLPMSPGTGAVTQVGVRAESVMRAQLRRISLTEEKNRAIVQAGQQAFERGMARNLFQEAVKRGEAQRLTAEVSRRARNLRKLLTRERLELLKGGKTNGKPGVK